MPPWRQIRTAPVISEALIVPGDVRNAPASDGSTLGIFLDYGDLEAVGPGPAPPR